jgi:integrase
MAVVERERKSGSTFYAVNDWRGKQISERVGTSKREAEIRDRAMKREIAAGSYQPPGTIKAVTLGQYAEAWGATRTNASGSDERSIIGLHILPHPIAGIRLDEVRPVDVAELVRALKARTNDDGSRRLSDKTIANAVGVLRQIFEQALREDRCVRQPVKLAPGTLKRRPEEERETYTVAEVIVLTRHHAIPWPIRVLNALCLFTGLRKGEACGRRWRDLDDGPKPLPSMTVRDQYDGQKLKTDRPRVVPVHPELQLVLAAWAREGFELYVGRKPEPDDFIVPTVSARAARHLGPHSESSFYKAFVRGARAASVRPRSVHATRHTFISLCRRGGARSDVLERVTHNASGKIIDRYTHWAWKELCDAVLCLRLDVHQDPQGGNGTTGELPPVPGRAIPFLPSGSSIGRRLQPGSIPDASTTSTAELGSAKKSRQAARQDPRKTANSTVGPRGLTAESRLDGREHPVAAWSLALAAERVLRKCQAGPLDDSEVANG